MSTDSNNERDHKEVMVAFDNLVAAATSLDLERYFSIFDKQQFTSLNHDGNVFHEFTEFESDFHNQIQSIEKYNDLQFQNVKISSITPDVCVLVNEYSAELVLKGGDVVRASGAGAQVWRKRLGTWLLTHISSSLST